LQPPAAVCKSSQCPWIETVLHSFTGRTDGAFGNGNYPAYADQLAFDQAGNIYGTAPGGGTHGYGVVFQLTHSGGNWSENVLWNFTGGVDGGFPVSGVIFDQAGNFYGTTLAGGANGNGAAYEFSPSGSGWTQSTIYSFTFRDVLPPYGGLTIDGAGNLYGTAGAFEGGGGAYEISLSNGSWSVSKEAGLDGGYNGPFDTPTLDAQGNLYGTAPIGENGYGEVFKMTPSGNGWIYTAFYRFNGSSTGVFPIGEVMFDANGNMYGTTSSGGQFFGGIVWEITP
jgi:uncharacterized repeat protein (TIGR03803 family)